METATTTPALAVALRAFATQNVQEEEVEFVAELLLAAREDHDALDAAALAPLLVESLEDLSWLDGARLQETSEAMARALTGESQMSSDEESDESTQQKVLAALKSEYAIDKSCLAVLSEDEEWHPARIRRHVEDEKSTNGSAKSAMALSLEVEFIEFGKLQIVQLEDVVLDEDVAVDGDDDLRPGRCEMCEREMKLTFHHLTPRVTHAKYLKKGYTREFLNLGVMICRPCHSKIHSCEDNKTLARDYNTLEKVMSHPDIVRFVNYVSKQKSGMKPAKKSKWQVGK